MTDTEFKMRQEEYRRKRELYKELFIHTPYAEIDKLVEEKNLDKLESLICEWGATAYLIKTLFYASHNKFLWNQKEYVLRKLPKHFKQLVKAWSIGWNYKKRMESSELDHWETLDVDPHLLPATRSPLAQFDGGDTIKCGGLKGWRY